MQRIWLDFPLKEAYWAELAAQRIAHATGAVLSNRRSRSLGDSGQAKRKVLCLAFPAGTDLLDNYEVWLQVGMHTEQYDLRVAVGAEDLFRMPDGVYIVTAASLKWTRYCALHDLISQMVLASKTRALVLPEPGVSANELVEGLLNWNTKRAGRLHLS